MLSPVAGSPVCPPCVTMAAVCSEMCLSLVSSEKESLSPHHCFNVTKNFRLDETYVHGLVWLEWRWDMVTGRKGSRGFSKGRDAGPMKTTQVYHEYFPRVFN